MIRVFIAIELSSEIRQRLGETISHLKRDAPRVRWVPPENLHLTLKFLGDTPEEELPSVFAAVDELAASVSPFFLEIQGVGCFPHLRAPRVIWAGCGEGTEEVQRLARQVEDAFYELGFGRERRPFHPHITLGRVNLPRDAASLSLEEEIDRMFGALSIESITVFMSTLKKSGAEYAAMHHALLGGE